MTISLTLRAIAILLLLSAATTGCAIYKPEIIQGNVVNQTMIDQLRPGMTREQVRFIMGTPQLADPFRSDRWDYVAFSHNSPRERSHYTVSLFFEDDRLSHIESRD